MLDDQSEKELQAHQAIQARLNPGEKLLEFTRANGITYNNSPHYIGLTTERVILMPLKGKLAGQPFSLGYGAIRSIQWHIWLSRKLQINLLREHLDITFNPIFGGRRWQQRAKELAHAAELRPIAPSIEPGVARQRQLDQIGDLQRLGFPSAASMQLDNLLRSDPIVASNRTITAFRDGMLETQRGLKVAASFMFGDVIIIAMLAALVYLLSGPKATVSLFSGDTILALMADIAVGAYLWRGHAEWRNWAVLRAILGIILVGIVSLPKGQVANFITQAAFSASILLVLIGNPSRRKTWSAIIVYLVGYPGVLFSQLVVAVISGLLKGQ